MDEVEQLVGKAQGVVSEATAAWMADAYKGLSAIVKAQHGQQQHHQRGEHADSRHHPEGRAPAVFQPQPGAGRHTQQRGHF